MNLATLVSSLVLAASTATAGLLVAPLHPTAQDGGAGPRVEVGPLCVGVCGPSGNETADGNGTAPPPSNATAPPPPSGNQAAPPSGNATAPPTRTCGVEIDDSQDVEGPSRFAWSWEVGSGTENLTVDLEASGVWSPLGGGVRVALTDGDGNPVAATDHDGSGLPFGYTAIRYAGDRGTGLSHGTWHLEVEADGVLGSVWLRVHSAC